MSERTVRQAARVVVGNAGRVWEELPKEDQLLMLDMTRKVLGILSDLPELLEDAAMGAVVQMKCPAVATIVVLVDDGGNVSVNISGLFPARGAPQELLRKVADGLDERPIQGDEWGMGQGGDA